MTIAAFVISVLAMVGTSINAWVLHRQNNLIKASNVWQEMDRTAALAPLFYFGELKGRPYLQVSITNNGRAAATSVRIDVEPAGLGGSRSLSSIEPGKYRNVEFPEVADHPTAVDVSWIDGRTDVRHSRRATFIDEMSLSAASILVPDEDRSSPSH